MELKDGDLVHYAHCRACGVICISNNETQCEGRAEEHYEAHGSGHASMTSSIGFTVVGNLPR